MSLVPAAALALLLASLAAIFATERAASRITGPLGWSLFLLLAAGAGWLLRGPVGTGEALAVATVGLMAVVPVCATLLGWRRRQKGPHGRR